MPNRSQDEFEDVRPSSFAELIPLSEAADISELSQPHLANLARKKKFWALKMGRNWFTTEAAIREYIARDRKPGPKPEDNSR